MSFDVYNDIGSRCIESAVKVANVINDTDKRIDASVKILESRDANVRLTYRRASRPVSYALAVVSFLMGVGGTAYVTHVGHSISARETADKHHIEDLEHQVV